MSNAQNISNYRRRRKENLIAIVKWCKAENLPFRKKDIKNFTDEQWELV